MRAISLRTGNGFWQLVHSSIRSSRDQSATQTNGSRWKMVHAREVEDVLEDTVALVEGVRRAGLVGEAVADILARPQLARRALPVFRHDADGRFLEQFGSIRVRGAFEIGDDGQRLILDPDRGERPVGRALVLGGGRRRRYRLCSAPCRSRRPAGP